MVRARTKDDILHPEAVDHSRHEGDGHRRDHWGTQDAGEEEDETADYAYLPGQGGQGTQPDSVGHRRHDGEQPLVEVEEQPEAHGPQDAPKRTRIPLRWPVRKTNPQVMPARRTKGMLRRSCMRRRALWTAVSVQSGRSASFLRRVAMAFTESEVVRESEPLLRKVHPEEDYRDKDRRHGERRHIAHEEPPGTVAGTIRA